MADTVEVHVVLRPAEGQRSPSTPGILPETVRALAASSGAAARPQFEGSADPSLSLFWLLRVPSQDADALVDGLRALPEVDGAYLKPTDEPA